MFEPDGDYEFIKWEILDANNNYASIDNGVYVSINDTNKGEITYTLNNAPDEDENISLVLRPKVLERPQTISTTPMYDSSGTYRDVSIMVMFDSDMDEKSIYFDTAEIEDLKVQYGLVFDEKNNNESDFIKDPDRNGNELCYYAYKKQEGNSKVTVLKNIQIINNKTGESLTKHFGIPVFTDKRTLVIPSNKDNPVPASTTVQVVLSKDFSFSEPDINKSITLREAKKWVYFVNSSTDKKAPEPEVGIRNWHEDDVTRNSNNRVVINGTKNIGLYVKIHDNASGIPDFFTMNLIASGSNEIVRTYNINYTDNSKSEAEFGKTITENNTSTLTYELFNLDTGYVDEDGTLLPDVSSLEDGNYDVSFIFKDRNENIATLIADHANSSETEDEKEHPFFIALDTTPPEISGFNMDIPYVTLDGFRDYAQKKMQFKWTCEDNDYVKAIVKHKLSSQSGDDAWNTDTVDKTSNTNYTKTLENLNDGTSYDFIVEFYDQNNNITVKDNLTRRTAPTPIASTFTAEITGEEKNEITVTWPKPADEHYDGAYILVYKDYKDDQQNNLYGKIELARTTSTISAGENETYTITDLESATDYRVAIVSYDEEQGVVSSRQRSKHIFTAPIANETWIKTVSPTAINIGLEQDDFKDGVKIKVYKGTREQNEYTGNDETAITDTIDEKKYKINFNDTPITTIESVDTYKRSEWTDAGSNENPLIQGEKYYYKIVPEYGIEYTYGEGQQAEYNPSFGEPSYIFGRTQTAAVTNLQVVSGSVTTTSMKISWNKAAGVFESYSVNVNGQSYLVVGQNDADNPEYTITGLQGGKSYNYSVTTNPLPGGTANTINCTEPETTAPYAVPSFTLTRTGDYILANITLPENYDKDHSITWELATTEDGTYESISSSVDTTKTFYTINLSGKTDPAYYVRAKTTYNYKSTVSQSVYFVNADLVVSNLRATAATNDSITLSWNNPNFEFAAIQVLDSDNNEIETIDNTETSYTITGLIRGNSYKYKIKLVPEEGNNVTTLPVTSPYVYTNPNGVTNITTSTDANYKDRITISWTNPTGSYSSIKILNASNNSVIKTITDGSTSFTHTGLTAGQSMSYKIRVEPMYSYGSCCESDSYTNSTYPPVVTGVSSSLNSPTSMTVSWTTPASGTYNSYKLYYRNVTEGETTWKHSVSVDKSLSSKQLTGLTPGCLYYYYIATISNKTSGTGTYSSRLQPATVTNLNLKTRGTNSLELAWTKPTGNYTKYVLSYKKSSDSSWTTVDITDKSATSYTLSNLAAATQYNIKIKTNVDGATAANYNNETDTCTWGTRPYAVSNVKVLGNAGGVIVSWTNPSSTYGTGYVYYQTSTDGSNWTDLTCYSYTSSNSLTIPSSSITKDRRYKFVVRNYNSSVSQESENCTSTVFYSAAPKPSSLGVWSHDGSGYHTIRFWMPGTTTTTSLNANIYIDGVYDSCTDFTNTSSGTYVYYKLGQQICPTTNTGTATKKISIQVYNTRNSGQESAVAYPLGSSSPTGSYKTWSGETYSEILEANVTFNPNLCVDGVVMYYTTFVNVITSNTTITGSGSNGAFSYGRTVTLTPYSMAKAEVTEKLYNKIMNNTNSGSAYKPYAGQTYYQAITFCNRLSIKLGLTPVYKVKKNSSSYYTNNEWLTLTPPTSANGYWESVETDFSANGFHLPTECQWEFAARGGSTSATDWNYTYAGSSTVDNVAWYETNSGGVKQDGYSKSTNRLGIYGMSGNVYEMTNDYWVQTLPTGSFTNPTYNYSSSYVSSTYITCRGGSFNRAAQHSEVKNRNWYTELNSDGADFVGFRICRNVNY